MHAMRKLLAGLSLVGAATSTVAAAEWRRATSDHFIVYSEGSEKSLQAFTAKLENFDALLHHVRSIKDRDSGLPKLTVFLVDDTKDVRKSMSDSGKFVAGYYMAGPLGAFAVMPRSIGSGSEWDLDAEALLQHEYAHHFMQQYFPFAYPAWYVEGFAEFYSTAEPLEGGGATIGKPAKHRFYGLAQLAPMPSSILLTKRAIDFSKNDDMKRFYGHAWLLTHYLLFAKDRSEQTSKYLTAINAGTPIEKAATEAFGSFEALDRDLAAYKKARQMSYLKIGGFAATQSAIRIETLTGAESALVPYRLQWMRGVADDGRAEYRTAITTITGRFPDAAASHEALAEIALADEKLDEAQKSNDALLVQRPGDTRGLLRRAEIAAARLENAEQNPTTEQWKAVRALIAKANRSNPNDPLPLLAYYKSFHREGIPPTTLATDGLYRALDLMPQNDEIRLLAAQQLVKDRKLADARQVLAPLAYDPHESGGQSAALDMLAEVEAVLESAKTTKTGDKAD